MIEYGLLGEKLGHSFSKEIHENIAGYRYDMIERDRDGLKKFLEEKTFKAVNVTIPYKREVIPFLDEISPEAAQIGAVNCIRNDGGRLVGHNTDFDGLKALIRRTAADLKGKKVLILGTGGTSDTALAVCGAMNAEKVIRVSRKKSAGRVSYEEAISVHKDADIIINTTPRGMYPDIFSKAVNVGDFDNLSAVIDVVYNPLNTALVTEARMKGVPAEGGLYMLVTQAVKAAEFFLSEKFGEDKVEEIYKKLRRDKMNIVLTGMPASGKTTVGRLLAAKTGREFIDTDDLIEDNLKMTIPQIFEKYGEKYFRDAETEVIRNIAGKSGRIIATGGGAVLREENVAALKLNGTVFFRDRDPRSLIPTADRPKAFNMEEILKRYEERYPIYRSTADYIVKSRDTAGDAAQEILEALK